MDRDFYAERGLIVGIGIILIAIYFHAPTFFTSKNSLVEKNGKVENIKVYYTPVEAKGQKSIKSELKFSLNTDGQVYALSENVGQRKYYEKFEDIAQELKNSGQVKVWIKKSEEEELNPKVFEIKTWNNEVLYGFEQAKSDSKYSFPIGIAAGLFGIVFFLSHKYRKQIKRLVGIKPTHNNGYNK